MPSGLSSKPGPLDPDLYFLFIAMSSAAEVQSHLYVALDQDYIEKIDFDQIYNQADKTGKVISGLIKYLRSSQTK